MCEQKRLGRIKCADVYAKLPDVDFEMRHIAVIDPRLDTTQPEQVYALTMTEEQFHILLGQVKVIA